MNTKLDGLRDDVDYTRRVCLEVMDRRYAHAPEMANIYFKALHAFRVELRAQRAIERNIMDSNHDPALKQWRHGAVLTRPKGESK